MSKGALVGDLLLSGECAAFNVDELPTNLVGGAWRTCVDDAIDVNGPGEVGPLPSVQAELGKPTFGEAAVEGGECGLRGGWR